MHSALYREFHTNMLPFFILILGFISGIRMDECPEPEDIYKCKCFKLGTYKRITVDCKSWFYRDTILPINELQESIKGLLGKTVELNLYDVQDTLPSDVFSGIIITHLNFHSCNMDSLAKDDQLLGLEDHLESLQISKSSLVPAKLHLGHLKKLKILKLSDNTIPELGDDWLSNDSPSLEGLHIHGSNIRKIGNNAFSRLNDLSYLGLQDNRFGPVKRSMFPTTADRLENLSLENNGLTDLPADLFSKMPVLKYVYLKGNEITTLDERTWSGFLQKLEFVDVGSKIICDDRLYWIKSLKRISLRGECDAPKEFKGAHIVDFVMNH